MPGGSTELDSRARVQFTVLASESEDDFDVVHRNVTLSFSADVRIAEHWQLSLSVPRREYSNNSDLPGADRRGEGIGDITISALWQPTDFGAILGLRLPTGDDDLDRFAGSEGEIVPLGAGAFELIVGGTWNREVVERVRLFETLLLTIPLSRTSEDPPPGTVFGAPSAFAITNRLGASCRCFEWLDAYLALDLAWKRDVDDAEGDAGETLFFVSPGLVAHGPHGTFVDVSYRIAHELITVGIGVNF